MVALGASSEFVDFMSIVRLKIPVFHLKHDVVNQPHVAQLSGQTDSRLARCQHFGSGLERVGVHDFDVF